MNNKDKPLVLIVDDNPQNLQILGNTLKEQGCSPALAQSGINALNFLNRKKPSLILLDIMMPEMDGFEVCQQIKANPELQDIPVIFLSAKTEKEDVIKGLEIGAVDYVTKPFNTKELLSRVSTHLELRAAKESLKQKIAELNQINAEKDKFFSIIAHDLTNPFNTLLCLAELLEDKDMELQANKRDEYITLIHQSSRRGYNLLKNLLEWSRSQTGRMQFNPQAFPLKTLIEHNIDLLSSTAWNKSIDITTDVTETLVVTADKNMLDTVIRNLLSNAVKFTPAAGKINIAAQVLENEIKITIADNGIGIKAEDIDKLFRIDINHTTIGTRAEKGTGLGLILCKEFVEKNGGRIWVESEVDQGSQFFIVLPV